MAYTTYDDYLAEHAKFGQLETIFGGSAQPMTEAEWHAAKADNQALHDRDEAERIARLARHGYGLDDSVTLDGVIYQVHDIMRWVYEDEPLRVTLVDRKTKDMRRIVAAELSRAA